MNQRIKAMNQREKEMNQRIRNGKDVTMNWRNVDYCNREINFAHSEKLRKLFAKAGETYNLLHRGTGITATVGMIFSTNGNVKHYLCLMDGDVDDHLIMYEDYTYELLYKNKCCKDKRRLTAVRGRGL